MSRCSEKYPSWKAEKENTMDFLDELLKDAPIWDWIANQFPRSPEEAKDGIWYDGERFLCKTSAIAEGLADWMEAITSMLIHTSYYNPEEDEQENCVDRYTGWYDVYVDGT